jgi:hypothetical protein
LVYPLRFGIQTQEEKCASRSSAHLGAGTV